MSFAILQATWHFCKQLVVIKAPTIPSSLSLLLLLLLLSLSFRHQSGELRSMRSFKAPLRLWRLKPVCLHFLVLPLTSKTQVRRVCAPCGRAHVLYVCACECVCVHLKYTAYILLNFSSLHGSKRQMSWCAHRYSVTTTHVFTVVIIRSWHRKWNKTSDVTRKTKQHSL